MEERDILMARESAIKAATQLTDIDERLGYFKQKSVTEDTMSRFLLYYNKIYDMITTDRKPTEGFVQQARPAPVEMSIDMDHTAQQMTAGEPEDASLPQKKCLWGLAFGDNADPELTEQLKQVGLTKFNLTKSFFPKSKASELIDKYKK